MKMPARGVAADCTADGEAASLMRRAAFAIERRIDLQLRRHDLTHAQWRALKLLESTDMAAGMLAAKLGMDTGAVTRLLDRLEAKGLCERRRRESDRRVVAISLTDAGRSTLASTASIVTRAMADCFAGVDAAEVAVLRRVVSRLLGLDSA